MERNRRLFMLCLGLSISLFLLGCAGTDRVPAKKEGSQNSRLIRNDSHASSYVARPREHQHRPFETDRTGIAAYEAQKQFTADRQRKRAEHARVHQQQLSIINDLPLCAGVQELHHCPLLMKIWSVREVPGGVEMATPVDPAAIKSFQDNIRCHHSFADRLEQRGDICVLQSSNVKLLTQYGDGLFTVILTAQEFSQIAALRERIHNLVGPAVGK